MRNTIQTSLFCLLFLMISSASASDSMKVLPMAMKQQLAESFQSKIPAYLHENRFAYKQDDESEVIRKRLSYSNKDQTFYEGGFGFGSIVVPINHEYALLVADTFSFRNYEYRVEIMHYGDGLLTIGTPPASLLTNMASALDLTELVYVDEDEDALVINGQKDDVIAFFKRTLDWMSSKVDGVIPMSSRSYKYLSEAEHERFNGFFIRRIEVREDMMEFVNEVEEFIEAKDLSNLTQYRKDQARMTKQLSRFLDKYFEQFGEEMFMADFKELHTTLTEDPDAIVREIEKSIDEAKQGADNENLRELIVAKVNKQNQKYSVLDGVYSPLVSAVADEDTEKLKSLIKNGEDLNAIYKSWSAVNQAAQDDQFEMLKLLVEAGADISIRTTGHSPLSSAIRYAHNDIARYLLEHGANVDVRYYKDLQTPLIRAAKEGYTESAVLLLEFGADPLARNFNGDSAIDWARHKGHQDIVTLMEAELAKRKQ